MKRLFFAAVLAIALAATGILGAGQGPAALPSADFAVRSDGSILLPMTDGTFVVVGPARAAPTPPPTAFINAIVAVVSVSMVVAVAATLAMACRKRMQRRAAKAAADAAAALPNSLNAELTTVREEDEGEPDSPADRHVRPVVGKVGGAHSGYAAIQ